MRLAPPRRMSRNGGRSARQRSRRRAGSAARTHSRARRSAGLGGCPGTKGMRSRRASAQIGHALQKQSGVGMPRPLQATRPCARISTTLPAYITTIRSASPATTPRSWLISAIAMADSARSARSKSTICACTVTSSALVGSSAISSDGLAQQTHADHHALAHAARQLMRILLQPALRLRHPHALQHAQCGALRIGPGHSRGG